MAWDGIGWVRNTVPFQEKADTQAGGAAQALLSSKRPTRAASRCGPASVAHHSACRALLSNGPAHGSVRSGEYCGHSLGKRSPKLPPTFGCPRLPSPHVEECVHAVIDWKLGLVIAGGGARRRMRHVGVGFCRAGALACARTHTRTPGDAAQCARWRRELGAPGSWCPGLVLSGVHASCLRAATGA
jgi:hypothetical protein